MCVLQAQVQAAKACAGSGGIPRMDVQRPWGWWFGREHNPGSVLYSWIPPGAGQAVRNGR